MSDANGEVFVTARPWPVLVSFYEDFVKRYGWSIQPMVELVRYIAQGRLSTGLFAYTSHATLVLGQTPRVPMHREVLRIDFDQHEQLFRFEFEEGLAIRAPPRLSTPDPWPHIHNWKKSCPAEQGIATLEHFLFDQKKWFTR